MVALLAVSGLPPFARGTSPLAPTPTPQPTSVAAGQCYRGTDKGIWHDVAGHKHHYVEFPVNVFTSDEDWYLQSKPWGYPFHSVLWGGYYQHHHDQGGPSVYKEVGYNWPLDWPDPYPASGWVICHR